MEIDEGKTKCAAPEEDEQEEAGSYLTWGIFLVLGGVALFAREMGWISVKLGWLLPAILIAIGCGYLYEFFKKKKER